MIILRRLHIVKGLLVDEIIIALISNEAGYAIGIFDKSQLGDKSPHLPNDEGF